MSTVIEETKPAQSQNGAPAVSTPRQLPAFPMVAAPLAAVSATILAIRLARRRPQAPPKPSVYWSLSIASGNRVAFRPTLAPRFGSLFVRAGRPRRRGPFRRGR